VSAVDLRRGYTQHAIEGVADLDAHAFEVEPLEDVASRELPSNGVRKKCVAYPAFLETPDGAATRRRPVRRQLRLRKIWRPSVHSGLLQRRSIRPAMEQAILEVLR
jgi:hypothetical protein